MIAANQVICASFLLIKQVTLFKHVGARVIAGADYNTFILNDGKY